MKTIVLKILKEFYLTRSKILICILGAGLASWGISSVVFTYLMSERDFKSNFEGSKPADFSLRMEKTNPEIEKVLEDFLLKGSYERREVVNLEFLNKNGVWMPLILYGIENYQSQKLDLIQIAEKDLPSEFGIFMEKNARSFLDESQQILIRKEADKPSISFPLAGTVHDPLQAPAQMEQLGYAFANLDLVDSIANQPSQRYIFGINSKQKDLNLIKTEAENLTSKLEEKGAIITNLTIREPGKHIHQPIIDGASFLQKSFGAVLVIIGLTLFSLFLLILLLPQVPQIGTLKALGASFKQLFLSYNLVILVLICLGILLGMPLGILTAKSFNRFFAMVQNFEPVSGSFPLKYYLLVGFASIIVPLIFGLKPILRISKVSVREAMHSTFQSRNLKLISLLKTLPISTSLKYGIGNLFRNGFKTTLLFLMLILGITLFYTGSNLSYSFSSDFSSFFNGTPYQVSVRLKAPQQDFPDYLKQVQGIKSISPIDIHTATLIHQGKEVRSKFRKYSPGFSIKPEMILKGSDPKNCRDCIYFHPEMVPGDFPDLGIGDSLQLVEFNGKSRTLFFGGILREAMPSNGGLVTVFENTPLESYNLIALELLDDLPLQEGIKLLEETFQKNKIDYAKITDKDTSFQTLINHFEPTYLIVQGMGILTVSLSVLGILVVINLTFRERIAELAIIKSLGGSSNAIGKLFSAEFLLTSIIAILVSFVLSFWLSSLLGEVYGMMIRGQNLQSKVSFKVIIPATLLLLIVQWLLVNAYTKSKVKKSANQLLDSVE